MLKLQIALKECYETEYWLELLEKADILSCNSLKNIVHDCGDFQFNFIEHISLKINDIAIDIEVYEAEKQ